MQMTLVLCVKSEEEIVMVGCFLEVCRRGVLKINANKSKVMVLGEEEGLECEIHVNGAQLD